MGSLRVGVLGAGIVGVTSALQVQAVYPSASVTVVADKFNQDTTSDGAAGIFRPGTSFSGPTPEITETWLIDSWNYYQQLLEEDCGISRISGLIFSSTSPDLVRNRLLERLVPVYRAATKEELASCPGDWKYGSYFETLLTECRKFLPWALNKVRAAGGSVVEQHVNSLTQLEGRYDVVINCTGLGAKQLMRDHKLVPIRGQVFKVRAPWVKHFYYADYDTYIIPQPDGLVTLGGSRHYDSHTTTTCAHDLAAIRERCVALLPSLEGAEVVRTWTGLRPHRDPVRVELERVGGLKIIHNYGHGGYGITAGPGTSIHAVKLLREIIIGNSKL
uniref:FAD dependent oxidoreductase domain-containing protein n=1 Tax=Cuerna arida TaxID=1464854 RepID=A0A1B6ES01_9HEMI